MIIPCEKCNKKFDVSDDLIPEAGRLLKCSSCLHQWFFTPIMNLNQEINEKKNVEIIKKKTPEFFNVENEVKKKNKEINKKSQKTDLNKKSKIRFLNLLLVGIISFVALIIIIDTFRIKLSKIIPNLDNYLYSLYETLKDVYLFIINLIR